MLQSFLPSHCSARPVGPCVGVGVGDAVTGGAVTPATSPVIVAVVM
jgi:hypothetical protein